MEKINGTERPDWRDRAAEVGFTFADMGGEPYWDETSVFAFTLSQIEDDLEDPATELHALVREAVEYALNDEQWLRRMEIPEPAWDWIAASWRADEPELYGRMDFSYSGNGPAKLLEYNADTPTSLYETAAFQWDWLEGALAAGLIPEGSDQFNSVHEALAARWAEICARGTEVHFAADPDNPEDYATVEQLAWAAREAGLGAHLTALAGIGVSPEGQFTDDQDRVIGTLFKLYPWEDMLRDDFAPKLPDSGLRVIEPPWKSLVSNKALLPLLWHIAPGHPNLLPACFADEAMEFPDGYVEKPIFSREGGNIAVHAPGHQIAETDDGYGEHPRIRQGFAPLPDFDGWRPVMGVWIVGREAAGLGIREDRHLITRDTSRFKPHMIRP